MEKAFLSARWVNLLMANFPMDKAILEKYLPAHTEIDLWEGKCYVSLVGFLFKDTRVKGISFPFHKDFEEVNLRFYVRHKAQQGWRRGVVFVKEIVPRKLITFIANTLYDENYETRRMSHTYSMDSKLTVEYRWKVKDTWNFVKALCSPEKESLRSGSEAEFITEHYWGYAKIDKTHTVEYEVKHPSWSLHRVENFDFRCDVREVYGEEFEETLNCAPASVFLAEGSEILVMNNRKLNHSN